MINLICKCFWVVFMKRQILTDCGLIEVDCRITHTKNINIRIKENGDVYVTHSAYIPIEKVDDFVKLKAKWIIKHSKTKAESYDMLENASLNSIFLLGKEYALRSLAKEQFLSICYDIVPNFDNESGLVYFKNNVIYLFGDKIAALTKLKKQLKIFAQEYFVKRVEIIKSQLNFSEYIEITVKNVKSWWGTCNKKDKKMQFNLRLIARTPDEIDSVIYHEFAHLKVAGHSKQFYKILFGYCPQYATLKAGTNDSKYTLTDRFFATK